MKIQQIIIFFLVVFASFTPTYGQTETCPENLDFTVGFELWSGTYGTRIDPFLHNGIISTSNFPYTQADQQPSAGSNVLPRHSVLNATDFSAEPHNAILGNLPSGVSNVLKLGNSETSKGESLSRTFIVTETNFLIDYHIAGVLKNDGSSIQLVPLFAAIFYDEEGNEISEDDISSVYLGSGGGTSPDRFVETGNADSLEILPWETIRVDLSDYIGDSLTFKIIVLDGGEPGLESFRSYAYCYFSASCTETLLVKTEICPDVRNLKIDGIAIDNSLNDFLTNFENLTPVGSPFGEFGFEITSGATSAFAEFEFLRGDVVIFRIRLEITVLDCAPPEVLCPKFYLEPNKEYYLTYWSKNIGNGSSVGMGSLSLDFFSDTAYIFSTAALSTNPLLINQWVRKEISFVTPSQSDFSVQLKITNLGSNSTFFDDIRIIPVNARAVSYVYDPETRRLTAELDANNYATFYEYDNEGNLLRIKKETETGIHTIKESRLETIK